MTESCTPELPYDTERWLPVVGWMGFYEVSDLARVRSVDRVILTKSGPRHYRGRVLKPGKDRKGYLQVFLQRPGESRMLSVHQVVAAAFIGPRPPGMETRHLDGNKLNCHPGNLAYGTGAENMQDQARHGTNANTLKTHCSKGHEYTEGNIKRIPSKPNARFCRECHRIDNRERMARKRTVARSGVGQG